MTIIKEYVLGVDGGGTKTLCALFDTEGNQVDQLIWGPTNHEVLADGFQSLKVELTDMTACLLQRNSLEPGRLKKSVFGMAGVDTKKQHAIISKMLEEIGYCSFELCNDAYLGIKAGSKTGWGIGVVHGTGLCVAGIDQRGNRIQIGGQGMLTGDIGGGTHVGEKCIQAIYNYYFRCKEYTCMLELLPDKLKGVSKYGFIEQVISLIDEGSIHYSDLNRIVFRAANLGDKIALNILEELGNCVADSVNGCIREMQFEADAPMQIILSGSVNTKAENDTIVKTLVKKVTSQSRDCRIEFMMLDKQPVVGAVMWALEEYLSRSRMNQLFF